MRCKALYITLFLMLSFAFGVSAQEMSTLYLRENPREEFRREIISDTLLFYRPLSGGLPIYDAQTDYGLGFVSYSPRGRDDRAEHYFLGDVELPSLLNAQQDYIFLSGLRRVAVEVPNFDRGPKSEEYVIDASSRGRERSVRVGYGDRRYRGTLRLLSAGTMRDWQYVAAVDGRTGRDSSIDGLFGNSLTTLLSLENDHIWGGNLSLSLLGVAGEQSIRGWSSEEVFGLTNNRLYNPYWGYFDGRVRSSRVRRSVMPTLQVSYGWNADGTDWELTGLVVGGERSRSGLQWVNAMNPTPDYYTYLPSYQADSDDREALSELWRSGVADYTQIRWEDFWFQNSLSPDGRAVYLMEQAVERPQTMVVAIEGRREVESRVRAEWGAELRSESSRYFKRVEDLLGASWTDNRDGFLIDDVEYGERTENDLQSPNRIVREGDTYGYNYRLNARSAALRGGVEYSYIRLVAAARAELSVGQMWREGLYEKATFEGGRSLGRSDAVDYTAWRISGDATYTFTPRSIGKLSLFYGAEPMAVEGTFYDARYSNDLVSERVLSRRFDLSADYSLRGRVVRVDLAAYYNHLVEPHRVLHYYDDLSSTYLDMVMHDIRTRRMGVEAGVTIALSPRIDITLAGSLASYDYLNNPLATLRKNAGGEPLLSKERILLRGYKPTSSPEQTASVGISYSAPWSWWINAEWFWVGGRYMELSPVRRSERVIAAAATPEARRALIEQRPLGNGSQLNLFIYRSFDLDTHTIKVSLSLNNLLNNCDVLYGGYEPSRLHKQGSALARTVMPHAPKVNYVYPRAISANVTYEF